LFYIDEPVINENERINCPDKMKGETGTCRCREIRERFLAQQKNPTSSGDITAGAHK
jgi:hypothetical protein